MEFEGLVGGSMAASWYVLQVYSGHESKVKTSIERLVKQNNLQDKILQVKIPTMDVAEMKNGKKKIVKKRLMPGYILIEMEMNDDLQYAIQKLPSVGSFVGKAGKPDPLTLEEVKNLFNEMGDFPTDETQAKPKILFKVGEVLKIIDGPFANFNGVVDEIYPDKGRLRVRVEIFGRSTPVELDYLQVGKL